MFAFCAVLPTEQENTQPALQTLLTNGKIHIVQLLSQQSFHLSVHLLPYKRKPKSTLTAYEKEPHSDVLDRPVIGMWLFRFLIVCTAVFLVMLYTRLSLNQFLIILAVQLFAGAIGGSSHGRLSGAALDLGYVKME